MKGQFYNKSIFNEIDHCLLCNLISARHKRQDKTQEAIWHHYSPSPLFLISAAVWHMTQEVQQKEVTASSAVLPWNIIIIIIIIVIVIIITSMLYLSLASCLASMIGTQGMRQNSNVYNTPLFPGTTMFINYIQFSIYRFMN